MFSTFFFFSGGGCQLGLCPVSASCCTVFCFFSLTINRASDRVRKKITNYAEIFRNIMWKKVLIMQKTHWIMQKIFGSLRSPKITYFHAAEIELPQKPRVCSQATNCGRFARWHVAHRPLCSLKARFT